FKDAAPRLEQTDEGDFLHFEGHRAPVNLLPALAGKKAEEYRKTGKLSEARPGGWEPRARLEDLALDGVDAEALCGGGPLASQDLALHRASFRAYNTWLADFCSVERDRLLGTAYIPMWDTEEALEELQFAAERGLRGVVIPAFPPAGAIQGLNEDPGAVIMLADPNSGRNYFDPEFDPFWQRVVELGMPIHMHLGARRPDLRPEKFLSAMTISK